MNKFTDDYKFYYQPTLPHPDFNEETVIFISDVDCPEALKRLNDRIEAEKLKDNSVSIRNEH